MKLKLSMLALGGLMLGSALTTTGCGEDVLGVNDTVGADTEVDAGELSAPTAVALEVTSATTATLTATTANATDEADGYYLINEANVVVKDTMLAAHTGTVMFDVMIDKDSAKTWSVKAYKGESQSTAATAMYNPIVKVMPEDVNKVSTEAGSGLAIDGTVTTIAAGIAGKSYIDEGTAVVFFESSSAAEGVTITPVNSAKIIPVAAGTILDAAILEEIRALTTGTDLATGAKVISDGSTVYTNGKSPRVGDDLTAKAMGMVAGQEFIVVASDNSVARITINTVGTEGATVGATVSMSGDNAGVELYKTIK